MADSENSRTLPTITRRKVFSTTVALASAGMLHSVPAAPAVAERADSSADPALRLWHQWIDAHQNYARLSRRHSEIAAQYARETGSTEVMMLMVTERDTSLYPDGDFGGLMPDPLPAGVSRADLIARLKRQIQRDKEADDRIGHTRARQAMNKASEQRSQLADRLATAPALCLAGAVAKLSAFIDMNTPLPRWSEDANPARPMAPKPSWPQLRSILDDLIRQGGSENA